LNNLKTRGETGFFDIDHAPTHQCPFSVCVKASEKDNLDSLKRGSCLFVDFYPLIDTIIPSAIFESRYDECELSD